MSDLTKLAVEQKEKSDEIYETRILTMLGQPVKAHRSSRTEIKVFKLEELGYRGYIAKVKLFDPRDFKCVLAKDKLGAQETTLQAVKRTGALWELMVAVFIQKCEMENLMLFTSAMWLLMVN